MLFLLVSPTCVIAVPPGSHASQSKGLAHHASQALREVGWLIMPAKRKDFASGKIDGINKIVDLQVLNAQVEARRFAKYYPGSRSGDCSLSVACMTAGCEGYPNAFCRFVG